jgi:geranylgeranyl diphosphate synthase type I
VVNDARGTLLAVREKVQSELSSYLTLQREYLSDIGSELIPVCDALESFLLEGGKRLRPLFAYAGFAATGKVATTADIRAFTSLELLQACALIHDDLMDRSDTRRGKPAIHRHFENLHQQEAMSGLADQFGGPNNKKFMRKRMREMLLAYAHENCAKQKDIIQELMLNWKGQEEQTDDILLIGVRI